MKLASFAFLADENIDPEVTAHLVRQGLDVETVRTLGLAGSPDTSILQAAHSSRRVVISHDRDFGALAIADGQPVFGIAFIRPGHIQAEHTIGTWNALIEANLDYKPPFIVVATRTGNHVRVRCRAL